MGNADPLIRAEAAHSAGGNVGDASALRELAAAAVGFGGAAVRREAVLAAGKLRGMPRR